MMPQAGLLIVGYSTEIGCRERDFRPGLVPLLPREKGLGDERLS